MDRCVQYKPCSANKRTSVLQRMQILKHMLTLKNRLLYLMSNMTTGLNILRAKIMLFRKGNTAFKSHPITYPNLCVCLDALVYQVSTPFFSILSESFRLHFECCFFSYSWTRCAFPSLTLSPFIELF